MIWTVQRIADNICRRFDVSILYHSKVGVKSTYQLTSSELFGCFAVSDRQRIPTELLHVGVDGLKDANTLLSTRIVDSPYFELMESLRQGRDTARSSYVLRAARGTLDFRPSIRVGQDYLRSLEAEYTRGIENAHSGDLRPIQVIRVDGKYYVVNGKHRAAVCASEGIAPPSVDVSPVICDSFFWWVYRKMLKRPRDYQMHIRFFESIRSELPRHGIH